MSGPAAGFQSCAPKVVVAAATNRESNGTNFPKNEMIGITARSYGVRVAVSIAKLRTPVAAAPPCIPCHQSHDHLQRKVSPPNCGSPKAATQRLIRPGLL